MSSETDCWYVGLNLFYSGIENNKRIGCSLQCGITLSCWYVREITYLCLFHRELIAGQKEHKRKIHRLNQKQSHKAWEDTELGRIHVKIKALLAIQNTKKMKAIKDNGKTAGEESGKTTTGGIGDDEQKTN